MPLYGKLVGQYIKSLKKRNTAHDSARGCLLLLAGVACVNTNRNFIGIEMDEKYYDIATKRIDDATKGHNK